MEEIELFDSAAGERSKLNTTANRHFAGAIRLGHFNSFAMNQSITGTKSVKMTQETFCISNP